MKRHSGAIAIIILVFFILAAYLNVFTLIPESDATTVTQFTDGTNEFTVEFPNTVERFFQIPADANVTKVSVNISSMEFGGEYPEDIQLIFGETLPYDWAYRGEGHGAYGNQEFFSKGQRRVNLSYDPDKENDTLFFALPKNTEVSSASIKMTGFEWDYWEPWIKEVNRGDTQTWNMDPYPFVYNNRLWAFYRSYNSTETDESDADIAYNWTTDGVNWQTFSRELTKSPDTESPYPDPDSYDHRAGDFHPFVVEYNNNLGIFWGSMSYYAAGTNESGALPGGGDVGVTHGSDRDIVVRWFHNNNNTWSDYIEITDPTDNADESNYTNNPGGNPLGKDDRRPFAIEFKNKIWVTWVANNTGNTSFHMHDYVDEGDQENPEPWFDWRYRGDIMISNSSDGYAWDKAKNLCENDTKTDAWFNRDFYPTMFVWKNKLFVMWETNGRQFGTDVENRFDYDLVYRYTEDGVTWSDHIEMTPKNDTEEDENHIENSYPDEDPRLISFYDPIAKEDRLYCVWRTRNPAITNGSDYDIVIRYTTDGAIWSEIKELTNPDTNGNYDNKPELTVFDNKLYVVWRRLQGERDDPNPDGDIVTRHWDGKEWSPLQEVTPNDGEGNGRDDFYPNSAVFKSQFYTFWCTRNRGTGWPDGTDADVVYRRMEPSNLPLDTGLNIGDDDTWELAINTKLTDTTPSRTVNIKDSINGLLSNPTYLAENTWLDNYGNEMVTFMVKVYIGQPGRVRMDDLDIKYTCSLEAGDHITKSPENGAEPFRKKIMRYIEDNQDLIDQNGNIKIPLKISSQVAGKIRVHDIFLDYNMLPNLNILTPEGIVELSIGKNTPAEYTITWEDEDVDDNAQISFYYYKVNQKKSNAKLIVSNIAEDDAADSFTWKFNKNDVTTGRYNIFGRMADGIDSTEDFAPGTLNITWEKQYPPWIKITQPSLLREAWNFFIIQWEDYDPDDNAKVYLYYTANFSDYANATQIDLNDDGIIDDTDFIYEDDDDTNGAFDWNITFISPGSKYYIAAKIVDGFNPPVYNCSLGRVIKKYISSPQNFTLSGDTNPDPSISETHSTKPTLGWRMLEYTTGTLNFHLTVWEGSSAGIKKFEIDTGEKTISASEITAVINTQLEYGKTYYSEVYAFTSVGARSEPASLQFSCVNNLPEVAKILIRPPDPASDNAISCDADGSDPDGDVVELKYKWFKNGVHQPEYDDKLNVISAAIVKGDSWKVEVTPFDGFILGAPKSISVAIDNSRPTCDIQEPLPTFEIRDNKKTTVRGTYEDADGDELVLVSWYVDIDDPTNYTAMASEKPIKQGDGVNVLSALEFKYEFTKGTHNLTLVVFDADSLISMTPSYDTIQIEVTRGGGGREDTSNLGFIIGSVAGVVIIIILLILLMLFFKRRKPVSEREKMYGKDMGLKQGEAYPVEEEAKSDSYFGDKLDRKGVSSLDSSSTTAPPAAAPVTTEKLATAEAQTPQMPEKTEQPQLPPGESGDK